MYVTVVITFMYSVIALVHCADECSWKKNANTWTDGDLKEDVKSRQQCQSLCAANSTCAGVDWIDSNSTCWFSGRNQQPADGITHYRLDRNVRCTTAVMITTTTTTKKPTTKTMTMPATIPTLQRTTSIENIQPQSSTSEHAPDLQQSSDHSGLTLVIIILVVFLVLSLTGNALQAAVAAHRRSRELTNDYGPNDEHSYQALHLSLRPTVPTVDEDSTANGNRRYVTGVTVDESPKTDEPLYVNAVDV